MNNKLKEFYRIKENFDKQVSEEIKKTGLFFAFSKEQFEENKTYKDIENMKYYSIGLGGYIAEKDKEKYYNFNHKIFKKKKKDFINKVKKEDLILHELYNHESYYTYDIEEVVEIIQDYYNEDYQTAYKQVRQVFEENKKED